MSNGPRIKPLSSDTITGTGTITLAAGNLFGGFDLNTDGTNVGTVIIRNLNVSGTILVTSKSITGKTFIAPIEVASNVLYYDISGTGADCFLYEFDYARSTKY